MGVPGQATTLFDSTLLTSPGSQQLDQQLIVSQPTPTSTKTIIQTSSETLNGNGTVTSDVSNYDKSTGQESSEQIQQYNSTGAPQYNALITYNTATISVTDVTVNDASGDTQFYSLTGLAAVQLANNSTTVTANAGPVVLLGVDNTVLNGGSSNDLIIGLGNGVTVNGGMGNTQVDLLASGATANVNGATVNIGTDISANIVGNGNNVTTGGDDLVGAYGGGNSLATQSGDHVYLSGTNGNFDTVTANKDNASGIAVDGETGGIFLTTTLRPM